MVNVAFGALASTLRAEIARVRGELAAREAIVRAAAAREHAADAAEGEVYDLDAHVAAMVNEDVRASELAAELSALATRLDHAEDDLAGLYD